MIDRRIIARPFRKPCQQSSFRQRQLFRRFAEIELRSCLEPEYAMPQRNLVRVQSKNLRLGEAPLDLDRKHRLLYLALPSPIGREKQVARQLHRQRGRALNLSRRLDIPVRSTDDPPNPLALLADTFYLYYWDKQLGQISKVGLKSTPAWFLLRDPISFADVIVTGVDR